MKTLRLLIVAIVAAVTAACNTNKKDNTLLVSIEPQRAMLNEIVGDRYEVVSVLSPGANPETFEPSMNARKQIERAAAYFTTGNLPFEQKLTDGDIKVVDTSVGITPVYGTHDHGHDHGHNHDHDNGADPHVWTSVKNARIMAHNMYNAVVEMDPDGKDYYTARWSALDHRLDSLDRDFAARLADAPRAFAIWHPSLSYMARDYGLEQIAVGFENKEIPAGVLKDVIDEARADGVRVFFFQKEFDSRQANSLNDELGTELVQINLLTYDWERELDRIVSAMCR